MTDHAVSVPDAERYSGPVKHSVTIAGHQTSISLEPLFWAALRAAAEQENVSLNALIARIDELRLDNLRRGQVHKPANLASAIRCWLWIRNVVGAGCG